MPSCINGVVLEDWTYHALKIVLNAGGIMGQYRHSISSIMAMTGNELGQKTTQLYQYEEGRFFYFLDEPKHKPKYRLNIVGHSSPVGSPILFWGTCEYAHGMNLNNFCKTVHNLLNSLKNKGHNIQCIRIIACWTGANGLAQRLANHLNMPVKGSLGGTRIYSTSNLRPTLNINRHFIDKPDGNNYYFPEEGDRQRRHDPAYGLYRWYYPQLSGSDCGFEAFINERISR
ncbi:hypothetical protein [Xenorhabdus sp. BG5]|uniref:hypothetical protein n=1 Tax=Xenorhabdus sp. BG5 TaxID=2782014 RepID=UPI0019EB25FA|nr:hypothetical protein [Xenorhabdus sp. BG5]MBE8597398.1 hypothetical protein [Xenorhabdus sp. BG5]